MWVTEYTKAAPDKFSRKVNCGAVEEGQGDSVNEEVRRFEAGMGEVVIIWFATYSELHLVLIAVASARLDCYSKSSVRVILPC